MMLVVGLNLAWMARDTKGWQAWAALAVTAIVSVATNMAIGFIAGLVFYHVSDRLARRRLPNGIFH
jgi:hypothetical protein